ncbi:SDR family oxidoreductase [Polyangium aurulentum]|uniref:SDR family oxidoreductase n=1 Tax=Polyangium aurulentum TaxID=2567896 RepID=UPI0010AEA256|nr:SDR family oxidoreductase [Polyangium aurulentum]UQA62121.1 SDR family oxidoreductase [Polyangium aurulentum]
MFKDACLKGRTAIVTGGGTGLGLSMALKFADLGANLVLTSRDPEHIEPACEKARAKGAQAIAVRCDVRDYAQVEAMVDEAERAFGSIDILVNNAAGNFLCPTEDLSPNGFNAIVGIVLNGTFHATLAAGKRMIASGKGGSILNILATYAWTGSGFVIPSASAKAGVMAMTRSLAVEWAKYKIRVNGVAPGPFPTEGAWKALVPDEMSNMGKDRIPLGRYGEHEELANLAAYLVSDYSGYITGDIITIDGGAWLAEGGTFNQLARMDPATVKPVIAAMRGKPAKDPGKTEG